MYCCPYCFSDSFLRKYIIANKNQDGKCSFCGSENVAIIKAEYLFDLFEPLLNIYKKDDNGNSIDELIQSDWDVFAIEGSFNRQNLLKSISNNSNFIKFKYKPAFSVEQKNIEQWENFREELKHSNRFFPNNAPTIEILEPFGKYLGVKIEKSTQSFYRARINSAGRPFEITEMGKPPKKYVSNGRANPIGIPYLYITSKIDTAIAEVRAPKGETVTIAEFELKDKLELADLRNPKSTISPFELEEEELELIYKNLPFLEFLGKELSKPIIPREADLEYLSSQYLSELLKHIGFHGIIYRSSIAEGNNYVIFDDERLRVVNTYQYKIMDVKTSSKKIE